MRFRRRQRSSGQSLVEFALLLPVLLLIIFGVVDFGRAIFQYSTVAEGARQAGRLAVVDQTVADVKQDTKVPILLPSSLTTQETKTLYGGGEGEARRYSIAVSTVKNCSANACAVASFSAMKGIAVYGDRKVTLAKGRKGRYIPLSCGGSCSPPSIVWKERGVVYEISTDATRAQLVRMANSAIRKGPR
jgi:hypothetical protein